MLNKIWLSLSERVWHSRWRRFYSQSHWHLVLDLSLIIIIICLLAGFLGFYFYRPTNPGFSNFNQPAVDLNNPPLEISFQTSAAVADLNQGTTIKINFKNNGPTVITDLNLEFVSATSDFNVSRLEKVSGDILAVNGRQILIKTLRAGASGEATLKVYFNLKNEGARLLAWHCQTQYVVGQQVLKNIESLSPLKIAATVTVSAGAYFSSPQGDQLGIGPIPPIVGIPTKYWIFWEIKSTGALRDLVFSGYLPSGVSLTDNRSLLAGEFAYNNETRQLVWKVPEVNADEASLLSFEITATPLATQVGKTLSLLTGIRYYFADPFTSQESRGELANLDSNLAADIFNAGRGTVTSQ